MAKIEKGTRVRGLPPKIRLSERDNLYGTFPLKQRLSSDGRGGFDANRWDEVGALPYYGTSSVFPGLVLSGGFYSSEPELTTSFPILRVGYLSSEVTTSYSIKRGISDSFLQQRNNLTSVYTPYEDAKFDPARRVIRGQNSFYETGSKIVNTGIGFQQPLWSKQKITVEMPLSTVQSMSLKHGNNQQEVIMTYYDFGTGKLNPVGSTRNVNYYVSMAGTVPQKWEAFIREKAIGFYGSLPSFTEGYKFLKNSGNVYLMNGFPFGEKYLISPTSSMAYPLKNIINRPFLAEKITLEFSGSYNPAASFINGGSNYNASVAHATFFILNLKPRGERFQVAGGFAALPTVPANDLIYVYPTETVRSQSLELVTYAQLTVFGYGNAGAWDTVLQSMGTLPRVPTYFKRSEIEREFVVRDEARFYDSPSWEGQVVMSAAVKLPTTTTDAMPIKFLKNSDGTDANFTRFLNNAGAGRTGTGDLTFRNWRTPFPGDVTEFRFDPPSVKDSFVICSKSADEVPYILMPSDKLIFGWQTAFPHMAYQTPGDTTASTPVDEGWDLTVGREGSILTLSGSVKLVIYGSYLKVGDRGDLVEDNDDSLNQLLSSDSIHEIIG